jgi:hypothetical protein
MATYTLVNHNGLTGGHANGVEGAGYYLVEYTAQNVPWNELGSKPSNYPEGITYSAAFKMTEIVGAQQKWEGHAKHGGYRLDLQAINGGYANFSVQTNGKNSVTVALCLMQVDHAFTQGQLLQALLRSVRNTQMCQLTP